MLLEIVSFWVVLWYNNHRDVYMVNIIIGLGLVLYIVGVNSWLSLYLLMMIIPLVSSYINILAGLISGIFINESLNKFFTLLVVMVLGSIVLDFSYVLGFMVFVNGILSTVLMSVYVFVLMGASIWILLMTYILLSTCIADNYKILGLGILPLVIFFVNICGGFLLIWFVIIYAIFNVL